MSSRIRYVPALVAFAIVSTRELPAQARAGARAAGDVAREIADVEARIDSALARRDTTALVRLVADSFTFVHAMDGRVDSRATWLADAARGMALSRQRNARMAFDTTVTVYGGYTAVRTARVRLRIADAPRESWLQQTMMYVRQPDGWRLAHGQGTRIYDGPVIDTALYRRYAGTYAIDSTRSLVLEWDGYALMARWPNGTRVQTFLASPTDELVASPDLARLRFTLGSDGRPSTISSVRGTTVLWRAQRVRAPSSGGKPPGSGAEQAALLASAGVSTVQAQTPPPADSRSSCARLAPSTGTTSMRSWRRMPPMSSSARLAGATRWTPAGRRRCGRDSPSRP